MRAVIHMQEQKAAEQEAARAEKEAQRAAKAALKAQRDAMREAARKQKEVHGFAYTFATLLAYHHACGCLQCHRGLLAFKAALGCQPCCRDSDPETFLSSLQEERNQKAAQKKGFDTKSLHKTQNLLMVRTHLISSQIGAELCTVTLSALLTIQLQAVVSAVVTQHM